VKAAFLSVSAALVFLAAACGGGATSSGDPACDSVCASINACPLGSDKTDGTRAADYDCVNYCGDAVKQQQRGTAAGLDAAGTCKTAWDSYIKCYQDNQAAVCNPTSIRATCNGAGSPGAAWTACMVTYCSAGGRASPSSPEYDPTCQRSSAGVVSTTMVLF
jgi:hypothetical protein